MPPLSTSSAHGLEEHVKEDSPFCMLLSFLEVVWQCDVSLHSEPGVTPPKLFPCGEVMRLLALHRFHCSLCVSSERDSSCRPRLRVD